MTDTTGLAHFAALDLYLKALTEKAAELRASTTAEMGANHDERKGAVLPDGMKIASVTRSDGNKKARVINEAAALEWCKRNYPGEVQTVEMIRPAFLEMLLTIAKDEPVGKGGVDPRTGEALPFISVARGAPFVTVTKTPEGWERMQALVQGFGAALTAAAQGVAAMDAAFPTNDPYAGEVPQ